MKNKDWIIIERDKEIPPMETEVLVEYYPRNPIMEGTTIGIARRIDISKTALAKQSNYIINKEENYSFSCFGKVIAWQWLPERTMSFKNNKNE